MRLRWDGRSLGDAQDVVEALALVVVTWIALGWYFDRAITQLDGTLFLAPYTQSALAAGTDWTDHLYRFGVLGGSPMHDYAGTLPLLQVCSALGLSTTATLNIGTIFLQLCFAFFGLKTIEALSASWAERAVALSRSERLVATWLCGFAPLLAWRLAIGHENILQGLLPIVVACALLWQAHAGRTSAVSFGFGFFAVFNGVSGLGAQLVIYSGLFGAPLLAGVLATTRPWRREHIAAVAVVVAGAFVALPRLAGMIAYATSSDAGRSVGDAVAFAFGTQPWGEWLSSLPWTREATQGALVHEHNYPVGPLLVAAAVLWPRRGRVIGFAFLASALLAILFAANVRPVSSALLALPLVESFRIPARAIMPVLVFVPSVALAAYFARRDAHDVGVATRPRALEWLTLALALAVIALHERAPAWPRELAAWMACAVLAISARWRPHLVAPTLRGPLLAFVAVLGVHAFSERLVRGVPNEPITQGPAELRRAVLAQAPELAMPLVRVQLFDAPPPYRMSLGFAAGLGSLDGDFNPPRRFVRLLAALQGRPIPSSSVVFELGRTPFFAVLQQLYNMHYAVRFTAEGVDFDELPSPPGAAWFPARVQTLASDAAIGLALLQGVRDTAWLLDEDRVEAPTTCTGSVEQVRTDARGQTATISVRTETACTLVVATNYVRSLRATADGRAVSVFPIDIALTGIAVPADASTVVLAPAAYVPGWALVSSVVGVLLLAAAVLLQLPRGANPRRR